MPRQLANEPKEVDSKSLSNGVACHKTASQEANLVNLAAKNIQRVEGGSVF